MTRPTSKHTTLISLLLCILLAILVSSCNLPMTSQNPAPQEEPSTALETVALIMTDTPEPTATSIPEEILRIETIPIDLAFMDGRNVKAMTAKVGSDENTRLEVALDNEGGIVAYHLTAENEDLWVVNPLIETGFRWNFGLNENGQIVLHHALEEWNYKPFPIGGIRYVKPDQLPVTFWDESDPVREDEQHPWPSEGTLAVFDGEGDILMYYSKQENAWWFAGYQSELPGNMVYRQSSMTLAVTGVRYKPIEDKNWTLSQDLSDRWQEIRNSIDWVAYTRRTGNYISFENFSNRVNNGEIFEYQSMLYDLATQEYKLTNLTNKTKIYLQTQLLVDTGSSNSYDSSFHALYHLIPDSGVAAGILLYPDNSIAIIYRLFEKSIKSSEYEYTSYLYSGISPLQRYIVSWLAANDEVIKEGIKYFDDSFKNILSDDERKAWFNRIYGIDPRTWPPTFIPTPEEELSMINLVIFPNVESAVPRQKP